MLNFSYPMKLHVLAPWTLYLKIGNRQSSLDVVLLTMLFKTNLMGEKTF